jgi:hypothetical protein
MNSLVLSLLPIAQRIAAPLFSDLLSRSDSNAAEIAQSFTRRRPAPILTMPPACRSAFC